MAVNGLLNLRAVGLEAWADFRASDRFFKYKAGVFALWLGLATLSGVVACPGAPSGAYASADNTLSAKVQTAKALKGVGILVRNDSGEDWTDLLLILNDTFHASPPRVKAGDQVVLSVSQFVGEGGKQAPLDLKPRKLRIRCAQGEATLLLEP